MESRIDRRTYANEFNVESSPLRPIYEVFQPEQSGVMVFIIPVLSPFCKGPFKLAPQYKQASNRTYQETYLE
jgi:hypothetical protein